MYGDLISGIDLYEHLRNQPMGRLLCLPGSINGGSFIGNLPLDIVGRLIGAPNVQVHKEDLESKVDN